MHAGRFFSLLLMLAMAAVASAQTHSEDAERLLVLANQTRVAHGLGMLAWDPSLARAAAQHCRRMAAENAISHQFAGEDELSQRGSKAGARFSLIEENVAVAASPERIHAAWMNSPGHRANLLNAKINRVGIAVIAVHDALYAVADYSLGVPSLSREEAESGIAALLRQRGLRILDQNADARIACEKDRPRSLLHGDSPRVIFRWEESDLSHLPGELNTTLQKGSYNSAAVGSCSADNAPFTLYRMAVLLYAPAAQPKR